MIFDKQIQELKENFHIIRKIRENEKTFQNLMEFIEKNFTDM